MTWSILVVEDDTHMREGIQDTLEMHGYEVWTAKDGADGLQVLESLVPDLILSDIAMPTMDGYEFYEAVRRNPRWTLVPFIFLTARGERTDILQGKRLGVDDYLTKPFETEDLLTAVEARLKRMAEVRAATEAEKDELRKAILDALPHELRTPLTYIKGYTSLLLQNTALMQPEIVHEALEAIRSGGDRIGNLVEDFVFLVTLDTGEVAATIEAACEPIDLRFILRTLVTDYQQAAAERQVTIELNIDPSLPRVQGYAQYLANALGRLLSNAIKFSKRDGGRVTIQAWADQGEVHVAIKDTGIGLPAAEIPKIFERFYQVDRARLEQQGVGLGLPIARGIIEAHGGRIVVESEVGVGSTFTVILPIRQADGSETAAEPSRRAVRG
ncbi:MAG: hybrid sensor histidine kinase/response regulator [Anaerolineae bacterium]|jgi:signal transduction histidine kinase|nr:hybrid sensor histidine kinase/response regulator [Anaerolineae bacterium]MDH7475263.1 response regulator [Anaerolineae bacterium]